MGARWASGALRARAPRLELAGSPTGGQFGGERSLVWASALLAAGASGLYLLLGPPGPDLAAQVYRAGLAAAHGIPIWDGQWYGGHYLLGYSLLAPLAEAAIGAQLLGVGATMISAAAFAELAHRHFGARARVGALWFSLALTTDVIVGRVAFSLGLALALVALVALHGKHPRLGAGVAVLCSLASPVAGVLLALVTFAVWVAHRRPGPLVASLCALAPVAAMAWLFPQGGRQPFTVASCMEAVAFALVAVALLPRRERVVRVGALLYAVSCALAFAVPTPLGSNVLRLGMLFEGPLLACVLWVRSRRLAVVAGALLLVWQWFPAISAISGAAGDPSTRPEYFRPLLAYLNSHAGTVGRIEIPSTRNHWEAAYVAPRFPLARGWERQLDVRYDPLFYGGRLSAAGYHSWLRRSAVRYVAVPDAPLDPSAKAEVALIDSRPPYLRLVHRDAHWRVFAVSRPLPLVTGAGRLLGFGPSSFALAATRLGSTTVRVHYTPFWRVVAGSGCVEATGAGWTRVVAPAGGQVKVAIRFSAEQLVAPARASCSPGAAVRGPTG